ncbi:MAG TPA: hypothetical protein VJ885_17610 [Thermoanaerobaculia bacterium]|nr:hypothetical protein [Thermoanaerobaculia bacterium]
MSQSIRWVVRGVRGRVRVRFNWEIITLRSVVHVTAGEVSFGSSQIQAAPPFQNFSYILGEADIWVSNISPHRNDYNPNRPAGVSFILHVDWPDPLDVAITMTVEDRLPIEIQGY